MTRKACTDVRGLGARRGKKATLTSPVFPGLQRPLHIAQRQKSQATRATTIACHHHPPCRARPLRADSDIHDAASRTTNTHLKTPASATADDDDDSCSSVVLLPADAPPPWFWHTRAPQPGRSRAIRSSAPPRALSRRGREGASPEQRRRQRQRRRRRPARARQRTRARARSRTPSGTRVPRALKPPRFRGPQTPPDGPAARGAGAGRPGRSSNNNRSSGGRERAAAGGERVGRGQQDRRL